MPSSGMSRRMALVRTDVSEEPSVSIIRATKIGELGLKLAITSTKTFYFFAACVGLLVRVNVVLNSPIIVTLMMEASHFSETLVLTRATRSNIPGDGILHINRRENMKSYIASNSLPLINVSSF
jgi:hypothetical protein